MKESSIEELINSETAKRLEIMEDSDYDFPKQIGKGDWIAIIVGIVVCLVLIGLCMVGVID